MSVLLLLLYTTSTNCYRYLPHSEERFSYVNARNKHPVKITDVPHQALVVYDNEYCSGSLIFSRIVLTVASCFVQADVDIKCSVKLGANTVTGVGQIIPVIEKKIHEYYKHEVPLNNDIALLVLERNVVFGLNVRKVIIVEPEIIIRTGTTIDVTGWGGSNLPMKYVHRLLLSEMKIATDEECEQKYGKLKTHSNFCARYQPERRLSDNGGSALYKDHDIDLLVGMLSFGGSFTEEHECLALFTNISYFHRWIIFNSQRLLMKHCIDENTMYSSYEYNDSEMDSYEYEVRQYV
ncbi:trypsin 5G1-like [Plodia interpunctella]|uniref:trypsin 5G1-like n=1 Tax=Plodia interpunctella TaxID=58824 RepID=UPI002367BD4D|nr:trypsin 5G1-like [Plodia interpunctella]